jgi:hypothetical protein
MQPEGNEVRAGAAASFSREAWQAVPSVGFGRLNTAKLAAEDAIRDFAPGVPMRVGVNSRVPGGVISAMNHGNWEELPDGRSRWRLRLEVPHGEALRVHFSRFDLPEGGRLVVVGEPWGPSGSYTGRGLHQLGDFWSTATAGPDMYLEYTGPARQAAAPLIETDEVSQLYRNSGLLEPAAQDQMSEADGSGPSLPCHVDVNCRGADLNARDSVARIVYTVPNVGTFLCSGALLSDADDNTYAGYFLTANHCIDDQPTAHTVIAHWFYQTSSCGGAVPSLSTLPRSEGADLLATGHRNTSSDFTLLRFYDDPHDGQGFAAWTNDVVSLGGIAVRGIHHPGGSWKRYARGVTTGESPICCTPLCTSRFIYNDWSAGDGVTEGGSSGSPLFNAAWEVLGQLYGVCFFSEPDCDNPESYNNVYGRFTSAYPNISSYLNAVTPDDEYEDNDVLADAAALDSGTFLLRLVDFDDYFAVEVTEDTDLAAVATFDHDIVNVDLHLYDGAGLLLDSSTGTSDSEEVSQVVPAGTYVIRAIRDGGRGGDYTLAIDRFRADCVVPAAVDPEPGGVDKNRFISFVPGNAGVETGIRVTLASLHKPNPPNPPSSPPQDFSAFEGQAMWVGPPAEFREGTTPTPTFRGARLQCDAHYQDWGSVGLLHVYGPEIAPSSTYEVRVVEPGCNPTTAGSTALSIDTRRWGDIVTPFSPSPGQPNFEDISALVSKFKSLPGAVIKARARLHPGLVDPDAPVGFLDIGACVEAYKAFAYSYSGLTTCP